MTIDGKEGSTVIVIPAYNEADNIGKTIDLIRETKVDAHIIERFDYPPQTVCFSCWLPSKTSEIQLEKKG